MCKGSAVKNDTIPGSLRIKLKEKLKLVHIEINVGQHKYSLLMEVDVSSHLLLILF